MPLLSYNLKVIVPQETERVAKWNTNYLRLKRWYIWIIGVFLERTEYDLHLKAYATPFLTQPGCKISELNYVVDVVVQEVMMTFDFLSLPSPDTSYF